MIITLGKISLGYVWLLNTQVFCTQRAFCVKTYKFLIFFVYYM